MNNTKNLIKDLQLIRAYTHGAHSAAQCEEAASTYHQICHKLDDVISNIQSKSFINRGVDKNIESNNTGLGIKESFEQLVERIDRVERFINLTGDE